MKITYNKNPLLTSIELTPEETDLFKLRVTIKELKELLFDAHFYIEEGKYYDLAEVRDAVDPAYYLGDKNPCPLDGRVAELVEWALNSLKGAHDGDCTCVPCSCSKCHAEELLGINTIKGMGKHSAYKIRDAFGKDNERTMQEALDHLKNYDPEPGPSYVNNHKLFYECLPRWKKEAEVAYNWLLMYSQEHFQ